MTDNSKANAINDMLRSLSTWVFDRPAYWLLGIMYKIFFNVSTAELFTNATIKNFYTRVQLIIGVFMVFKLAVTILQGIVNPDKFTDKNNGINSIITRVIFALVMLVLLVPINIPSARNEWEIQLNNNGLLFGSLYSLQNRLLSNNTLGRLILGTTDNATTSSDDDSTLTGADKQAKKLEESADIFASTILKGFLRINLIPEEYRKEPPEGKSEETLNENRMCKDIDDATLEIYSRLDASTGELLDLVNASCTSAKDASWFGEYLFNKAASTYKRIKGDDRYVFAYIPILPAIVAFIFVFILFGFTVDIAVRSVKLAVLRLIAPIPIISYIKPSKDGGAFGAWVKTLTTTYLDLFIRLAVVYFVIFLIQDMIVNGIVINNGTGIIGIISAIFIWIGLFFFARQAPKFIRDVLGLKGNMQNIGLSAMLGGTAALAGGGGLSGAAAAAMNATDASVMAANTGKQAPPAWSTGRDLAAQIRTGDPKAKGGIMNDINDNLMRRAGINAAWKQYGISQNGLKIEKQRVEGLESEAAKLQDAYNRLSNGNMSTTEQNDYAARYGINPTAPGAADALREAMYTDMTGKQGAATKARKGYDEVKKFGDSHRLSPSTEEKFRRSWRERVPGSNSEANRADFYENGNFVARRTEHHGINDRISGGDNGLRWRPGSDAAGLNQYQDNPDTTRDTPGRGQGPGAGMPPM